MWENIPPLEELLRITDIRNKTVEELQQLHHLGFDYLTIGVESGDSETLTRVNKGYLSEDIVEQCHKLEEADIYYHFFYLVGLGGHGNGERNALRSAGVFNQLHPVSIGFLSLTLFPEKRVSIISIALSRCSISRITTQKLSIPWPTPMPKELLQAHRQNDRAVMAAYGFSTKMTKSECVAELFKRYAEMVE